VWLRELGLSQYAAGFEAAGYADWELLGCLEEKDLAMIELHANCTILPGHRKKILMASHQMGQVGPWQSPKPMGLQDIQSESHFTMRHAHCLILILPLLQFSCTLLPVL
jgi:hypothetical protein